MSALRCATPESVETGPELFPAARRLQEETVTTPGTVLTTTDHDRARAGLQYVYPVLSRRAAGLSVGVNLNPNNACNWRCVYCQVEGLRRGAAPPVNLSRLREELETFLGAVVSGQYLKEHLPPSFRVFRDIAISGNGEPTTAAEFADVVDVIAEVRAKLGVTPSVKTILITNGSQMDRRRVQVGVEKLAAIVGEVWYKVDRATASGIQWWNGTRTTLQRVEANLAFAAERCPTWIQTCMAAWQGEAPADDEVDAYVAFLQRQVDRRVPLRGVFLYTIARPPAQPEAAKLEPLPRDWLERVAARVTPLGLRVQVYD